uniref:Uncharacterized protein n=1 Tax=Trichobilharzia regenti TaxID=157069 RepID=A0AA85J0K5_TRIRE|nr:unnamed protein product [Trichobilharzia regenti]
MVRSRNKSSCTNSSINEIKLEFVNNANHIGNNSDEGGYINNNYERSSLISAQPTQLIHMERDLVNGNKYQDNNNNTEKTTSSETLDSNISQSNPIGGANIDIERVITIQSSKVRSNNNNNNNNNINNHKSTDNNLTHFKTSQETVSSTLSHNNNNNNNNNNSNYSDEPDRSISSPPILAPKPKACSTAEKILLKDKKKKKASTLTTSEIRYMNSKISSNLSSVKDISSLFSVGNSNKIEQLNDSTEVATELFPNLIRKRDTPIPNVKNLVSYFSELIKLHTDEEKHCSPSMSNSVNNLSRLKGFDSEMTLNHRHVLREEVEEGEVMRGEDEEEYELDIPTSVSPFLLHHETPTARERRLQAVESLRRRSTLHMKYDLYRVFPPGYSTASSSFLERLGHRVAAENMTDCSNNNNNDNHNINNSNGNICRGLDNDPIRRPLSAPKFQVRMQANLQKDSTAIAAQ